MTPAIETFRIIGGDGFAYLCEVYPDEDMGAPWDEHDGHGIVSDWTSRTKMPGELILNQDRGSFRYYDFAASCQKAREEGWNAAPYDVPGETPRQRAAKAAMADYKHLRAWCRDEWQWVGVTVRRDGGCPHCSPKASLWGIESNAEDYLQEVALELALDLIEGQEAA
jgi:hypothetical protein